MSGWDVIYGVPTTLLFVEFLDIHGNTTQGGFAAVVLENYLASAFHGA